METEIVPGTSVGPWALNTPRSEVIEMLNSKSIEYTEASPGGFDFVYTSSLSFSFNDAKVLSQICVVGAEDNLTFRGVSLGSKVEDLANLGVTVSMDINDRMLVIKDLPGVFFNFEGDDELDYEMLEAIYFEGDEGQLRDEIRPTAVLQSRLDRICISSSPEINPMFDLNA